MPPRKNTPSPSASVPVSFSSPEAREEFKRLVATHGDGLTFGDWGELVLIGDRVVVKDVPRSEEPALRKTLDGLLQLAETRAREQAEFHDASRRELLDAVMAQSRARAAASRFGNPG
jgi:hypothetical protein